MSAVLTVIPLRASSSAPAALTRSMSDGGHVFTPRRGAREPVARHDRLTQGASCALGVPASADKCTPPLQQICLRLVPVKQLD